MARSRRRRRGAIRGMRTMAVLAALAAVVLTGAPANASTRPAAQTAPEAGQAEMSPTLLNGWTAAPFGTRTVKAKLANGIVRLRGAVEGGSSSTIFVLPPNMRPGGDIYVPVDLCGATNGRLYITSTGEVEVLTEGPFADAQCFTSLDGAWFALSPPGSAPITLQNGWTPYAFNTRAPKVSLTGGVVYLKGAIQTAGSNPVAFTLPVGMRPTRKVYVPVDMCDATDGRLLIKPSGTVTVQADDDFTNAQCFTSLEGASFTLNPPGTVPLTLQHGWTNNPFNTRPATASLDGGVVRLSGAIATEGNNPRPFTLPATMRPTAGVYVQVDLCGAANGRLVIESNGTVTVEAEIDFADAQCFTSLEGASFVRN